MFAIDYVFSLVCKHVKINVGTYDSSTINIGVHIGEYNNNDQFNMQVLFHTKKCLQNNIKLVH